MSRRNGSAVSSDTQLTLGTQYRSQAERLTERLRTLVPTGTRAGTVPLSAVVLTAPSRGPVPPAEPREGRGRARLHERAKDWIDGGDVALLPAALWPTLPLPATLVCLQTFVQLPVHVTNSRAVYEALRRRKRVVFGQLEWLALVSSFENERANPDTFAGWCDSKAKSPTWKLNHRDAIGVIGDALPPTCSSSPALGRVLDAWGLHLQRVHYGTEVPQ